MTTTCGLSQRPVSPAEFTDASLTRRQHSSPRPIEVRPCPVGSRRCRERRARLDEHGAVVVLVVALSHRVGGIAAWEVEAESVRVVLAADGAERVEKGGVTIASSSSARSSIPE